MSDKHVVDGEFTRSRIRLDFGNRQITVLGEMTTPAKGRTDFWISRRSFKHWDDGKALTASEVEEVILAAEALAKTRGVHLHVDED
ncbi:MAG: Imm74 family immunity protein [Acidimicrobiales bacterium]|jgi:poly-gamma-glutamate capsule biosynthesis protein CapA/YwtB (metallophosphatase superfamily)